MLRATGWRGCGLVEITLEYEGELHCRAVHGPSGAVLETDAPADNMGRGAAFSPTDLVATALGTCVATTMAIVARRADFEMKKIAVRLRKHMTSEAPRRIARLEMHVTVPLPADHPERAALERAGARCPVRLSLHPDIVVEESYEWTGAGEG